MRVLIFAICFFASIQNAVADTRLVLMPGILYFDYEESTDDGTFLDGETGPVPGVSSQLQHKFASGITGVLHGSVYSGRVDYDGHAEPSGEPVQSKTDTNFFSLGGIAQFPLQGSTLKSSLHIGYQLKRWERDIQPTISPLVGDVSGLYEVYQWEELSMGAEVFLKEYSSQQWIFYVGVLQTINPRIEINLVADGDGKPKLHMGSDLGYNFSAQWIRKTSATWNTGFKMSYKTWRFGKSNSVPISGGRDIVEPRSRTNIIMIELVIDTHL